MAALRTHLPGLSGIPPLFAFLRPGPGPAPVARSTPPRSRTPITVDAPNVDIGKVLARAAVAPDLSPIEWDGDRPPALPEDPQAYDARQRRIRDRYISARFPGVARDGADLENAERVIHAARLYFEDGQAHTALELLDLSVAQSPHETALRLARLEILFLGRDAAGYTQAARDFMNAHPAHEAWREIARLGAALVPDEPLFGDRAGPRDHEHYGPWPHLPNWIRASWDLTAEVTAAEFHGAMARRGAPLH